MVFLNMFLKSLNYMNSEMRWDSIKSLSKQTCSMHWQSIDCWVKSKERECF